MKAPIVSFLRDQWKLLTFRKPSSEVRTKRNSYLVLGLLLTWLVGIGRYWDHPDARWWQYLGLGSVMYVFLLAAFIWLLVWPLRPKNWSYLNVLLFLTMTSAPGILYAIPVEMFLDPIPARNANTWSLQLVALWRVALFAVFLRRVGGLGGFTSAVGTFFPIFIILFFIVLLHRENILLNVMRGDMDKEVGPTDGEKIFFAGLWVWTIILLPLFAIFYIYLICDKFFKDKWKSQAYYDFSSDAVNQSDARK